MRARLWLPSVALLRGERERGKGRGDPGQCPVLPEVTVHILGPIFPSVTSSGARSSKPLRDLSVWLNRCWSLLMSDGTETWVRWTSQSDIVVLVCQQGHSGRGRNWPLPRQQFCHGGGQVLLSGCVIFALLLSHWLHADSCPQARYGSGTGFSASLSSSLAQSIHPWS